MKAKFEFELMSLLIPMAVVYLRVDKGFGYLPIFFICFAAIVGFFFIIHCIHRW